jgi:hypothetical protein
MRMNHSCGSGLFGETILLSVKPKKLFPQTAKSNIGYVSLALLHSPESRKPLVVRQFEIPFGPPSVVPHCGTALARQFNTLLTNLT